MSAKSFNKHDDGDEGGEHGPAAPRLLGLLPWGEPRRHLDGVGDGVGALYRQGVVDGLRGGVPSIAPVDDGVSLDVDEACVSEGVVYGVHDVVVAPLGADGLHGYITR